MSYAEVKMLFAILKLQDVDYGGNSVASIFGIPGGDSGDREWREIVKLSLKCGLPNPPEHNS
jgi:hypothetical protein